VWAAILLVVVIDRRDGMECLVGVLELLSGGFGFNVVSI
jgi:hypothetical protein